jgi:hypothetical protein
MALSNPLMQPTNACDAGRRPRPGLRPATMDRRLSEGRLQLISISLGVQARTDGVGRSIGEDLAAGGHPALPARAPVRAAGTRRPPDRTAAPPRRRRPTVLVASPGGGRSGPGDHESGPA